MKRIMILMLVLVGFISAQEFTVEKISGDVKILKGTSEKWETVRKGEVLSGNDVLLTETNSYIQLNKEDNRFMLKGDVAIGLNHIKEVSINDLLLALALDEIRNVPKMKKNGTSKNTAVYGSNSTVEKDISIDENLLGAKKLNGAKLLNENGYRESSVIVAKEVFRNYPKISMKFNDRLYFADILNELKLYQEASSEYTKLENIALSEKEKETIGKRIETVNMKLVNNE
ncbi:MAG: hypothetical protein GY936_10960 [Ignavibacteriae bacterium]|nr:hypothetical protein [Ignavibacteriota bacterium]